MRHFFILAKNDFLNAFAGIKKGKKKGLSTPITYLISFGIMLVVFIPLEVQLLNTLSEYGAETVFLTMVVLMSLIFSGMTVFRSAPSFLFNFKDHDLLFSMPISKNVILLEKLAKLHLLDLVFSLVFVVPAVIIYALKFGLGPINIVFGLLTFLVFSLLGTTIFVAISMLIMLVASKTRFVNAIHTFLSIALIILFSGSISFFSSYFSQHGMDGGLASQIMEVANNSITLPLQWWAETFTDLNLLSALKLSLISILPFIALILLFSKMFASINTNLQEKHSGKKKALKIQKSTPVFKSLFFKELGQYFKTPHYAFQTLFGASLSIIFLLVLIVLSIINKEFLLNLITNEIGIDVLAMQALLILILVLGVGYFTNLSPMSAASISVESKSLWILGTIPVEYSKMILVKTLIHPIVAGILPALLIAILCVSSGLFSMAGTVFALMIFLLFSLFYSNIGMFVNLRFQKFNWNTHAEIFNNSLPTFIMIIFEFVLIAIVGGSFALLNYNLQPGMFELSSFNLYFMIGLTLFLVLLNALLLRINLGSGAKRLENIIKDN